MICRLWVVRRLLRLVVVRFLFKDEMILLVMKMCLVVLFLGFVEEEFIMGFDFIRWRGYGG